MSYYIDNNDMSQKDTLSELVKSFEEQTTAQAAKQTNIVMVRCDGMGFSKWTKSLKNPFNQHLKDVMAETAKKVFDRLGAKIAYSASDEITFVLINSNNLSQHYGGGRFHKIVSHAAVTASDAFNKSVSELLPEKSSNTATFDARAWEVDSIEKAALCLLARQASCIRNSVFMLARDNYSHNSIQGLGVRELKSKMANDNIFWDDLPDWAKRGFIIGKKKEIMKLSEDEIKMLPEKHLLRRNPNALIIRNEISELENPITMDINSNISLLSASIHNDRSNYVI